MRLITTDSPTTAINSGWPGLIRARIFIFDVHTDPAKPTLIKTIDNFAETTGGVIGPHGAYARCPGAC